jgi:hypothetical protein
MTAAVAVPAGVAEMMNIYVLEFGLKLRAASSENSNGLCIVALKSMSFVEL